MLKSFTLVLTSYHEKPIATYYICNFIALIILQILTNLLTIVWRQSIQTNNSILQKKTHVGEFRKTRHPRNVKFNKALETCFSGAGNSRFPEAWNLWSLEFANVWSSGILIRWSSGVTDIRRPGTSTWRWREPQRTVDSGICRGPTSEVTREDMHEPMKKRRPIRESVEDPVRELRMKTSTNLRRSKVKIIVPKSPGLECELVADL
jgi:hypothetical protein